MSRSARNHCGQDGGTRSTTRRDLGVQSVDVVLGGKPEELVNGEFDGRTFERAGYAADL